MRERRAHEEKILEKRQRWPLRSDCKYTGGQRNRDSLRFLAGHMRAVPERMCKEVSLRPCAMWGWVEVSPQSRREALYIVLELSERTNCRRPSAAELLQVRVSS